MFTAYDFDLVKTPLQLCCNQYPHCWLMTTPSLSDTTVLHRGRYAGRDTHLWPSSESGPDWCPLLNFHRTCAEGQRRCSAQLRRPWGQTRICHHTFYDFTPKEVRANIRKRHVSQWCCFQNMYCFSRNWNTFTMCDMWEVFCYASSGGGGISGPFIADVFEARLEVQALLLG